MTIRRGLLGFTAALALVTGCKGATEPAAVGPTDVVITALSDSLVTVAGGATTEKVTYSIRNEGGPGSYAVNFMGEMADSTGVSQSTDPITVATGYTGSFVFTPANGDWVTEAVAVWSQPTNAAVATRTDCRVYRSTSRNWCL
jgi:hypothetical protein